MTSDPFYSNTAYLEIFFFHPVIPILIPIPCQIFFYCNANKIFVTFK